MDSMAERLGRSTCQEDQRLGSAHIVSQQVDHRQAVRLGLCEHPIDQRIPSRSEEMLKAPNPPRMPNPCGLLVDRRSNYRQYVSSLYR
jgi:hypothetical protein